MELERKLYVQHVAMKQAVIVKAKTCRAIAKGQVKFETAESD